MYVLEKSMSNCLLCGLVSDRYDLIRFDIVGATHRAYCKGVAISRGKATCI
jgi:hypothetical protein